MNARSKRIRGGRSPVDTLAPARVAALLRGRFGHPYVYRKTCASTQRLLASTFPEGAVAVCERQTAGRGRLGRVWHAPPGAGVLCSVLLRPPPGRRWPELSLLGGLALAETVESAAGIPAAIKWPNDVLVSERKVGGILAEVAGDTVVLGIGLNVNQRPEELPTDTNPPAGSLFTADGVRRERGPLLAELLARLEKVYGRWCSEGLRALHPDLTSRDALRGRTVSVDGETGVASGIDSHGRLELALPVGRRLVESGEILLPAE